MPILGTGVVSQDGLDVRSVYAVFVSGNVPTTGNKLISFGILVPISYLLMLSGALMIPYRFYRYIFHVVCAVLLISILIFGLMGFESANLELITIGMLGVLAGFIPIPAINNFVRHPIFLAIAYSCYLAAITIWNVPFWLQMIGVPLSLMVIYLAGISVSASNAIANECILLGKYSLFGYISQIAILQVLAVSLRHVSLRLLALSLSFVAAFLLTIVSVEIVDRLRAQMPAADKLYKAVFA